MVDMSIATDSVEVIVAEYGSEVYREEVDLRYRVLREPLGLAFSEEQLASEANDLHIVARRSSTVVGCLVLTAVDERTVQMRQVAVEPRLQSQGIGRLLVLYSETLAAERGWTEMMMHARESAVPFYLKLGYQLRGEPFVEVTIPHREMHKLIRR